MAITLSSALTIAVPPTASDREPYVPMPNGTRPVSPWTTSTLSMSMPSLAATTCANVVSWPCPWLCEPVNTVTPPVGFTRTSPASKRPARAPSAPATFDGARPHASMYDA